MLPEAKEVKVKNWYGHLLVIGYISMPSLILVTKGITIPKKETPVGEVTGVVGSSEAAC